MTPESFPSPLIHHHAACLLPPRMAAYMRPKCHALLLDAAINSPLSAHTNVYQVTRLGAACTFS